MILQIERREVHDRTKPSKVSVRKHITVRYITHPATHPLYRHLDLCYTFRRVWRGEELSRELLIHLPDTEDEWLTLIDSLAPAIDHKTLCLRFLPGDRMEKYILRGFTDNALGIILAEAAETARVVRDRIGDTYPLFPCTNTPPVVLAAE